MHPPEVKAAALELVAEGLNDCEISRRLGIARETIREWRRPTYVPRNGQPRESETCPRCWRAARPMQFTAADYSELLAVYLGDGCITEHARTQRLLIHLDSKYPKINAEIEALLQRCFLANAVSYARPSVSSWSGRDDTWRVLSV
jgi:Homeodomain-like domain